MTTHSLTAQGLHLLLRQTGIERSEDIQGKVAVTSSYGYSVEGHGHIVRRCTYCMKNNTHAADCIAVTKRAHVKTRQTKVSDGTFTVSLRSRGIDRNSAARLESDRNSITAALSAAGIKFERISDNEWMVG
jgi:hypothetical protein